MRHSNSKLWVSLTKCFLNRTYFWHWTVLLELQDSHLTQATRQLSAQLRTLFTILLNVTIQAGIWVVGQEEIHHFINSWLIGLQVVMRGMCCLDWEGWDQLCRLLNSKLMLIVSLLTRLSMCSSRLLSHRFWPIQTFSRVPTIYQ